MLKRTIRRAAANPDRFAARVKAFSLPVVVVPLSDMKRWLNEEPQRGDAGSFVLLRRLDVSTFMARPAETGVAAEPGFVTDFASIPFPVSLVMKPIGRYAQAALLHDWGYRTHEGHWRKSDWDELFFFGMQAQGVGRRRAWLMWKAVSWFGWLAWRSGPSRAAERYDREVGELLTALFGHAGYPGDRTPPDEFPDAGAIAAV